VENEKIIEQVMAEIQKLNAGEEPAPAKVPAQCGLTEFVGNALGDTMGIVIANIDPGLRDVFKIDQKYRAIGVVSARVGAGPQLLAAHAFSQ